MYRFVFACIALLVACGAVSAQTFTTLHDFGGGAGNPGGLWNDATISQGRDGGLFTTSPGSQTGLSAAFRVGPTGSFNVLHVSRFSNRLVRGIQGWTHRVIPSSARVDQRSQRTYQWSRSGPGWKVLWRHRVRRTGQAGNGLPHVCKRRRNHGSWIHRWKRRCPSVVDHAKHQRRFLHQHGGRQRRGG